MKGGIKTYFVLLTIVIGLTITPAITAGINTPIDTVVLKLANDNAINLATEVFVEENPNAIVVSLGSIRSTLVLMSKINNLIIVGHGFEDGIQTKDGMWSWEKYSNYLNIFNANKIVLLNCQSSNIAKFTNNLDNIHYFVGNFDARVGALITNLFINQNKKNFDFSNAFNTILDTFAAISSGKLKEITLGLEGYEVTWYIGMTMVNLLAALVMSSMATSNPIKFGALEWAGVYGVVKIQLIIGLMGWATGSLDFWTWISTVMWVLGDAQAIGDLVSMILSRASWQDYLLWGAGLAVALALIYASGGTAVGLKILAATLPFIGLGVGAYWDNTDCDSYVGTQTTSCDPGGGGGGGGGGNPI